MNKRQDDLVIGYVQPGTWWAVAWGPGMVSCTRSGEISLKDGESASWSVSMLQGELDEDMNCILP